MLVAGVFVSLLWYGSCLGMLYSVIWLPGGPDGPCYYLQSLSLVKLILICTLIGWIKCRKRVRRERYLMFNIDDNQILSSSGHCCHYLIITSTSTSTQNTDIYSQLTSYWSTGLRLIKTMEIISLCVTNWSAFQSGCLRFPDLTFLK